MIKFIHRNKLHTIDHHKKIVIVYTLSEILGTLLIVSVILTIVMFYNSVFKTKNERNGALFSPISPATNNYKQ